MTTTPRLGIPLISGQQAQPEITHNTMVVLLQALAGGAIDQRNNPPGAPTDGACYIVGALPTGAFTGHAHAIAVFFAGWYFIPGYDNDGVIIPMSAAQNGLSIFNNSTMELWAWETSSWVVITGGTGASRLIDLLDVAVTETATEDGDFLCWDETAGAWVPRPIAIPTTGELGARRLEDLDDVNVMDSGTQDGDVLTWDETTGRWVAAPPTIASSGGGGGFTTLKELLDVSVGESALEDGDFLVWDQTRHKWIALPVSFPSEGIPALESLPDVSIVTPADGDVLTYDTPTGKWIASPPSGSSGGAALLKDLLDVAVGDTSVEDGDFLMWDDSAQKWIAAPIVFPSPSSGEGGGTTVRGFQAQATHPQQSYLTAGQTAPASAQNIAIATPILVSAPMVLDNMTFRSAGVGGSKDMEWRLYEDVGSNFAVEIPGANGTHTYVAG
jgi:WD40 repeat protein